MNKSKEEVMLIDNLKKILLKDDKFRILSDKSFIEKNNYFVPDLMVENQKKKYFIEMQTDATYNKISRYSDVESGELVVAFPLIPECKLQFWLFDENNLKIIGDVVNHG